MPSFKATDTRPVTLPAGAAGIARAVLDDAAPAGDVLAVVDDLDSLFAGLDDAIPHDLVLTHDQLAVLLGLLRRARYQKSHRKAARATLDPIRAALESFYQPGDT